MTYKELEEIAIEYINSNVSLKDLAASHEISKTTLLRYFNREKDIKLNLNLQAQINEAKRCKFLNSKSTNGNKGKFILSKEEIISLANYYVENDDINLSELAKLKNVSAATLYNNFTIENLKEELYNAVLEKYELNHKSAFKK